MSLATFALACLVQLTSPSDAVRGVVAPPADTGLARLERVFDRLARGGRFSGSVLVAEGGRVLFERAYGDADSEAGTPLRVESRFDLASVSKPILAVAVLRLAERGLFQLDEPVAKWIDAFPYTNVTIHQLLNHTSGLLGHLDFFERYTDAALAGRAEAGLPLSNADVLRALCAERPELVAAPGARWDYNNLNYIVLGELAARAARKPLPVLLRDEVFAPAGMAGAYAICDYVLARERPPGLVVDYVRSADGSAWVPSHSAPGWEFTTRLGATLGDGGIAASTLDLLAFDRALAGGSLLSPSMLAQTLRPTLLADGTTVLNRSWVDSSYGLGWTVAPDGSAAWHTGDWGGFNTFFKRYLARDRTLIYLLNHRCEDWGWLGEVEALLGAETSLTQASEGR